MMGSTAVNAGTAGITAKAAGEWSKFAEGVTTPGTGAIGSPMAAGTDADGWAGNYVYYGQYGEGENRRPVKYRVLDTFTNAYGSTTMFLDCDTVLFRHVFRDDWHADDSPVWAVSDLYKVLNTNDDAFLKTSFTAVEQESIAESTIDKNENDIKIYLRPTDLNGEKIFVLDSDEASNGEYGYETKGLNTKTRLKRKFENESELDRDWWMRSPCSETQYKMFRTTAGTIFNENEYGGNFCYATDVNYYDCGVSPAFNVDLSSVVFASQVNDEKGAYGREYKLTLNDRNTQIKADRVTRSGNKVTVRYSVTDSSANDGITADTATVLILDSDNEVKYYAPLNGTFAMTCGIGTFTLPTGYVSDDKVYILAEDINGCNMTDYASSKVQLNMAEAAETAAIFTTNSMTLGSAISLNFYADLSGVPADKLNKSYVEFEVNGKKQKAKFNSKKTNKAGDYGFNCSLNSISMADDVKATLHYYDNNGSEQTITTTSNCETYLKKFDESDEEPLWNLIKGINDYGYYMQQYLKDHSAGSWTLGVDHKAMEKAFNRDVDFRQNQSNYISELKKMRVQKVWGVNPDIKAVKYSLVLDSNTAINFNIEKSASYTGRFEVKLDGKKVTPKSIGDNRYQVTAGGISAHLLAEPHTVTVITANGTANYTASVLSYTYECINKPTDYSELYAMSALYEYYKATLAYKNAK